MIQSFPICSQPDLIQYEGLPVAKIIRYPLEKRDYMPFAQARLCHTPHLLVVQMWAFEVTTSPQSYLKAIIAPNPVAKRDETLHLTIWKNGGSLAGLAAGGAPPQPFTQRGLQSPPVEYFEGEDLQGIYWGGGFSIDKQALETVFGADIFHPCHRMSGNLYKRCQEAPYIHDGSFFPADFSLGNGETPASFGTFEIVNY